MQKTGQGLAEYAVSRIGTPYFFGAKMEPLTESLMTRMHQLYPKTVTNSYMARAREQGNTGKVNTDCSGLVGAYRGSQIGTAQLFSVAYARLSPADYKQWANGVVAWRQGHVGVFKKIGRKYYVIEAKGLKYGTVSTPFIPEKWEYGLTFKDMQYVYSEAVPATWKEENPYPEPTRTLREGMRGDDVKWLQWELCEAGYEADIKKTGGIDGIFGRGVRKCVLAFQQSCKIEADSIVGPITKAFLTV